MWKYVSPRIYYLVHGNWGKRLQITMSSHTLHEIKTCIEIALRCVESDRVKRPTIAEIVDELNKIDNAKRSFADEDNLHSTQAKLYANLDAADAESALTVYHRDGGKEQEHMTLGDKILEDDPSDTEYPGSQTGGTLERFRSMWATVKPTLKAKSGGRKGQDGLLWCHDLARCQDGDCSVAVVQANNFLEDQCLVESGLPFGTVIGIFDGHGGPEAACFIRDHLLPNLREASSGPHGMTTGAIREAFLATDQGFISNIVSREWETKPSIAAVGSCCLVGVVHHRTLFIANLGDSRAVLGRFVRSTGEVLAVQLSAEHNVNCEEVRKELIAEHPDDPDIVVLKHNVWRVKGLLQVSRSIGDAYLKDPQYNREPLFSKFRLQTPFSKPILSASPSIVSHSIQPSDCFVIFASDGLWEHLTNQEAVDIVQEHQHAEGCARRLIKAALLGAARKRDMPFPDLKKIDKGVRRHFHDDITVIVLFFNHALQPLSIRCPSGIGS